MTDVAGPRPGSAAGTGIAPPSATAGLVSIVMPFLNAGRFIEEAIESILAQEYERWELILVDDGSTDRSSEVARRFAREHPERVLYVEHPERATRGASASRNAGLRRASGEFVAFLDADDVWLPHKLAEQVPLLASRPEVGMLYGNTLFWRSWNGGPPEADEYPDLGVPTDQPIAGAELLARCVRGRAAIPCTCSVLLRRDVVERVGGFAEEFQRVFTDQAFYAKILLETSVFVAGRSWDRYRIHGDSSVATAEREGRLHEARGRYLQWLQGYLHDRGLGAGPIGRALRTELWLQAHPRVAAALTGARRGARRARQRLGSAARDTLGSLTSSELRRRVRRRVRPLGGARFRNLRRIRPVSDRFGFDRGQPVDRYYIEGFLHRHRDDVQGAVLEVGDDAYTRAFGDDRVTHSDVLHVDPTCERATIIADLASAPQIPDESFDCVICTQTLHLIYDASAAIRTLHRILKPGGVLLLTAPGISQIDRGEWGDIWYWSFTTASLKRLIEDVFEAGSATIAAFGNVLTATSFLQGLSAQELRRRELDSQDPCYQVLIGVRARKAPAAR